VKADVVVFCEGLWTHLENPFELLAAVLNFPIAGFDSTYCNDYSSLFGTFPEVGYQCCVILKTADAVDVTGEAYC